MPSKPSLPIACDRGAFASSESFEQHAADGRRLLSLSLERRELAEGWELRLPNEDDVLLSSARWTAGERRCCPFFTFVIEREPAPGSLWLRITGPKGAKQVLDAELR